MLHPQIEAALAAMKAANLRPFEAMTPSEARAQTEASARANPAPRPVIPGGITNRSIPGSQGAIGVRIYRPSGDGDAGGIVYYHGGGHVVGSLDTHDLGIDPNRIGVAGDSAGANVAAVAAVMARDAGEPALRLQSLVYPVVDYGLTDPSHDRYAEGYGVLTKGAMRWFQQHYLRDASDAQDWRASPIKAPSLAGVAPAIIIAAECDVLRDEGLRYADALKAAGVTVQRHEFAGMIHGFFGMSPAIDDATRAQRVVIEAFRKAFA